MHNRDYGRQVRAAVPVVPICLMLLLGSATSGAAAASTSSRALKGQVAKLKRDKLKLKRQRVKLRQQSAKLRRERNAWQAQATGFNQQLTTVAGERDGLKTRVAQLETDNGNLRAGLPRAIAAVPLDDFVRLVIFPARDRWPCDDSNSSNGYWTSTTFWTRSYC